jgi:hypothetical protein
VGAGADNPYSLIAIFRHLAIKAGGAVYVMRFAPVEVVPWSHKNCMEEIGMIYNGMEVFVDPIIYVIKTAGSLVYCNYVAPLRYKFGGTRYCSYPKLRAFQDSQGYLAKTTELAYKRRSVHGEWRLALGSCAQTTMIDIIGTRFVPCTR